MGLVFLRHAYSRYLAVKDDIEASLPTRGGKTRALAARFSGGVNAVHCTSRSPSDPLLRLVLEQEPRNAEAAAEGASPGRSSQSWAMLIKRVYEVDPLSCPACGGQMAVVGFIEPPQRDVIEKILSHCGLWRSAAARAPPADSIDPSGDGSGSTNGSDNEPGN